MEWLSFVQRIQAIAQNGLAYCTNEFDIERYEELRTLSVAMMSKYTDADPQIVRAVFAGESGYQTPKVDIRAVVKENGKLLLVQESSDGKWALPGGWADIGYTPTEVAVKEVKEETGLDVRPLRLIAVHDKKIHQHPPSPHYVYKIFILCERIGGKMVTGIETLSVGFFGEHEIPSLSDARNTIEQITMCFSCDGRTEALID